MKTSELLSQLRHLGVKLWVEGGELKCKAPKGALTQELREGLGAKKHELIGILTPSATDSVAIIPRAPRDEPLVLSFTQQRLWFLDQMEPGVITYNMWAAMTLVGDLDVKALGRSIDEVVRRHEVLRTTFDAVDGVPRQIISPDYHVDVEFIDGAAAQIDDDDALSRLLLDRLERPFDLERGPMVRVTLLKRSERAHALILVVHHIVFDGLSTSVFFVELSKIYAAFKEGKRSPLPELEVQYADYAAWQRRLLEGEELEQRMSYWRRVLSGSPPVLELPIDHPRPAVQTLNGAAKWGWFADELADGIETVATRTGSTPFLVLLATYEVLLARVTGQTDISVGTAMANRGRPELQKLLGYFVNTLVLRMDLSGDPTFRELLDRAAEVFFGAVDHQDMPFERLVDEIQPERNLAYSPLFQTLFVLDQDSGEERTMGDIVLEPIVLENRVARTDLVVHAYRGRDDKGVDGRLKVGLEYNTDLFDGETIERFLECYETLLAGVVANPDARISQLPLLTDDARRVVLEERNATAAEYPLEPTHIQFEARVDRTPDAVALVFPSSGDGADEELTFRELDDAANRLANYLTTRGVQPRTLVGLALDRSSDMVVALLAIVKAGAAYVPLDPSYPVDRLAYMAEDAGLEFIVTTSELRVLLTDKATAIELDTSAADIAASDATRPSQHGVEVSVDDRMYVIYTSGSTGRPKGVELEHRSVSNFLASMAREPGISEDERLLAVTTLSFDISVLEVMLPLLYGGTLIVAPREAVGDGTALIELVERLRPAIMQATPATWRMLLLAGWSGTSDLRVFCGGEALPRELADEILPRAKELWNVYGPTETTIWSAVKRVEADGQPITIGHPIANTQIYILDANRDPLPLGVPGELYIAGDGLARGYLERPELTAERFLPDPFSSNAGARMYRTGDKARWLPNGDVECLGRIDNQVKLRGFRIELGEIEAVVADVDGVHQCVCVIREDTPGDQRLTAYVVPDEGGTTDATKMRDAAQDKLPAYMVPAAFVELDALPHTPNGKVDRNALLALDAVALKAKSADIVAPRNETERRIAAVWSEVLGLDEVSVNVNFFELGGHSLLLAQVRAKIKDALGADLSIIELFQFPTVSQLATRADAKATGNGAALPKDRSRNLTAGRKALMRRRRR